MGGHSDVCPESAILLRMKIKIPIAATTAAPTNQIGKPDEAKAPTADVFTFVVATYVALEGVDEEMLVVVFDDVVFEVVMVVVEVVVIVELRASWTPKYAGFLLKFSSRSNGWLFVSQYGSPSRRPQTTMLLWFCAAR